MSSKFTEYLLMIFLVFISMIILFLVYLGFINSQKIMQSNIQEQGALPECNCFFKISINENELILRNINCDYVSGIIIQWSDFSYNYQETILRNEVIIINHSSKDYLNYNLLYNTCFE